MPEIIPLGWFHTIMGIIAMLSAVYTLVKFKEISLENRSGQIYLLTTLATAVTALGIFQHGNFNPAHALAILTLLALAVGTIAATIKPGCRVTSRRSVIRRHCFSTAFQR